MTWPELYSKFVREGWYPRAFFSEYQLPDPTKDPMRAICLPRDTCIRFRANYAMLLGMVALLLGKKPEEVCAEDCLAEAVCWDP